MGKGTAARLACFMGFVICIVVGLEGGVGVVLLGGRLFARGIGMRLVGMMLLMGGGIGDG